MTVPAGYPPDSPQIIYNSVTLWLPRRFVTWDNKNERDPTITEGPVYNQVIANPALCRVKATTPPFSNTALAGGDTWDGTNAAFLTAWAAFYAWAGVGKVFKFYRAYSGSPTAHVTYFQYCVWIGQSDGVKHLTGNPRYTLDIEFREEGAARA